MRNAVEIAERPFEIAEHGQRRKLGGDIALLERQVASDLAERLRQRPFGALRSVPGDDGAVSDQAHVDEGQDDTGRRRERRWQDETESVEAGFDFSHGRTRSRGRDRSDAPFAEGGPQNVLRAVPRNRPTTPAGKK